MFIVRFVQNTVPTSTPIETGTQTTENRPEHLLSPHYFHSEMKFIMTLVDIGDRLVSIPKEEQGALPIQPLAHQLFSETLFSFSLSFFF